MKLKSILAMIVCLLFCSTGISANIFDEAEEVKGTDAKAYEFSLNTSIIDGTSYELVYDDERKLSELIWESNDTQLYGFNISYLAYNNINLNFDFMTNFSSSDGYMEDYDWIDEDNSAWTHYSKSSSDNENIIKLDFNVEIPAYSNKFFDLLVLLGFKYDSFEWVASGGYYIYSDDGFRDDTGTFDDVPVISYNQFFRSPYIGFTIKKQYKKLEFSATMKYSGMVNADDEDTHHLRDLFFEESFSDGTMLDYTLSASYNFYKEFSLYTNVNYLEHQLNKGSMTVTNLSTDSSYTYDDDEAAGISHSSHTITVGLKYLFDLQKKKK